ncbi:hypothetical protein F511_25921 [Dorcoceras hygrometricum]|uniref:Uncharacterized protein n=1 Tax=Dorcoceras hygrometricum TaxID=472368 RepID=A0A2Z7CHS9_9LAMI|nr:hypothetical protein F511_25921 [Dorcoceras hygrometricum]
MRRISATTLLNVFNGTTNLATLVGAYLSDTHFGCYKTLGFASVASFFGLLSDSSIQEPAPAHPSEGRCEGPDAGQMPFLLFGFALMIVWDRGHQAM